MSQYTVYEHRDNGRQVALLGENSKYKTVQVKFLDDGKETEYSTSTWKRYWKKTDQTIEYETDDEQVQEIMKQKEQLGIEVPPITEVEVVSEETAGDGTPYKQVMQEILQDEKKAAQKKAKDKKQKAEKKVTVKKEKKPVFDSVALQEYAIEVVQGLGGDYVQRKQDNGAKDMAQKVFRAGGKMFMHMSYPRYELRMDTRGVNTEELVPTSELTGFYSARFVFTEDTKQVRSKIKKILTQAYKSQLAKNNKKGSKK